MDNQTQPNPSFQPQAQTPISSSTNWVKIIIFTLVGLIIIAGSIYAGIQIGKKQTINQQPKTEKPTSSPTQIGINSTVIPTTILSTEPNPTTNPTINWKTYNPAIMNLNFSFRYPPSWKLKDPPSPQDTAIAYFYSNDVVNPNESESLQYYFYVTPTKGLPNVELSKEIINGYTTYKTDKLPSQLGELSYFITNNEKNYIQLSFDPYDVNKPFSRQEQNVLIFNQILSTFIFTK